MKKFLTVLLVIAVMFTFSFSSAFAAPTGTMDADTYAVANISKVYEEVAVAQAKAEANIEKLEADALYAIFAGKISKDFGNLVVTSDQVKAYYDSEVVAKVKAQAAKEASAIYGKIQEALNDKADYIRIIDDTEEAGKWLNADGEAIYNVMVKFTGTTDGTNSPDFGAIFDNTGAGKKSVDVAQDAFAVAVTDKLAQIAAISEGSYIAKDQDAVKTAKAKASKQVAQLGNIVANGSIAFTDVNAAGTVANVDVDLTGTTTGFGGMLKSIYTPAVNEAPATGALVNVLKTLTLSADEPTEAAKLAWAKAQVMAKFEAAIGDEYDKAVEQANKDLLNESLKGSKANQTVIDAANKAIADAKEQKEAALEIATYLVNNCDDYKQLINVATPFANSTPKWSWVEWAYGPSGTNNYAIASPLITASGNKYEDLVKVVGYVKEVKEEAVALKAEIAIDGTTAVDVDTLLEKAIDKIYKSGAKVTLPAYTSNQVLHTKQHALTGVDCFDVATATTVKINSKEYKTVNAWDEAAYEGTRLDDVKAIKKETKAAIMAAETVADAEAAFLAGMEKYNAVLDKSDKAMNQAAKAFVDLKAKYVKQLEAELDYVKAGINAVKANNAPNTDSYIANLTTDLGKAYTTDELTSKYNELSAEVKALKDKTTLEAEKKALEERSKAYSNKTVTVADKEDLVALRKDVAAFRSYVTRLGANTYVVSDYGLDVKLKAVADLEKKAVEDAYKSINKDSKATLDEAAAVAELDAAVDAYNDGWDAVIEDLENGATFDVDALSVDNLAKFKVDIFKAQIANVESMIAKLPADGSDIATVKAAREAYEALTLCQKISVADKYYDKLVDTEKLVARSVETLKIKASSSAKKGSITVKWTVTGDKTAADGYQVYKSTKAQKGYKKAITTKKTSFKNTKNLKKGTRYYYKVRAYKVVDGVTYYSDWSNKANRIAK